MAVNLKLMQVDSSGEKYVPQLWAIAKRLADAGVIGARQFEFTDASARLHIARVGEHALVRVWVAALGMVIKWANTRFLFYSTIPAAAVGRGNGSLAAGSFRARTPLTGGVHQYTDITLDGRTAAEFDYARASLQVMIRDESYKNDSDVSIQQEFTLSDAYVGALGGGFIPDFGFGPLFYAANLGHGGKIGIDPENKTVTVHHHVEQEKFGYSNSADYKIRWAWAFLRGADGVFQTPIEPPSVIPSDVSDWVAANAATGAALDPASIYANTESAGDIFVGYWTLGQNAWCENGNSSFLNIFGSVHGGIIYQGCNGKVYSVWTAWACTLPNREAEWRQFPTGNSAIYRSYSVTNRIKSFVFEWDPQNPDAGWVKAWESDEASILFNLYTSGEVFGSSPYTETYSPSSIIGITDFGRRPFPAWDQNGNLHVFETARYTWSNWTVTYRPGPGTTGVPVGNWATGTWTNEVFLNGAAYTVMPGTTPTFVGGTSVMAPHRSSSIRGYVRVDAAGEVVASAFTALEGSIVAKYASTEFLSVNNTLTGLALVQSGNTLYLHHSDSASAPTGKRYCTDIYSEGVLVGTINRATIDTETPVAGPTMSYEWASDNKVIVGRTVSVPELATTTYTYENATWSVDAGGVFSVAYSGTQIAAWATGTSNGEYAGQPIGSPTTGHPVSAIAGW